MLEYFLGCIGINLLVIMVILLMAAIFAIFMPECDKIPYTFTSYYKNWAIAGTVIGFVVGVVSMVYAYDYDQDQLQKSNMEKQMQVN